MRRLIGLATCGLAGGALAPARRASAALAKVGLAIAGLVLGGQVLPLLAASPPVDAIAGDEPPLIALQASRRVERVALTSPPGAAREIVLTQLAPAVNAWLLLSLPASDGAGRRSVHLENADPQRQRIALDAAAPGSLVISRDGKATRCVVWPGPALAKAASTGLAYAPLCEGRLYLRNPVSGQRSALAATTDFLRDHVWKGEQIIDLVKSELYRDAFAERAASAPSAPATAASTGPPAAAGPAGAPPPARLRPSAAAQAIQATGLGIAVDPAATPQAPWPGRWAGALGLPGVWVSVAPPGALDGGLPGALDAVESRALAFLVAFDLAGFELGFALGTDHPRLGWSTRVLPPQRDDRLPGPDGFASAAPLVRTGQLLPSLLDRVVATFTGGFKREHGAFRHGALAGVNQGSHYGFIEQGVVFSRLQPGLATLSVWQDGRVEMHSWRAGDERPAGWPRHARQNGVPLVEAGPDGRPAAGRLVGQRGAGNWSGSADEQLRSLRAGACIVAHQGRRFLVYGYFSSATPRAMAQAFLAYGCGYAMHLDMNALEHTYLALYPRGGTQVGIEHLVPGMAVLDQRVGGRLLPRFLAVPDDRDFFYLTARPAGR